MVIEAAVSLVKVIEGIHVYLSKDDEDPEIDKELLVLLRSFKRAYDTMDKECLGWSIDDSYGGTWDGKTSKWDLLEYFDKEAFGWVRRFKGALGIRLNLMVLKVRMEEHTHAHPPATITIDYDSWLAVARVPVYPLERGRLLVKASFDDKWGLYRITRLESPAPPAPPVSPVESQPTLGDGTDSSDDGMILADSVGDLELEQSGAGP